MNVFQNTETLPVLLMNYFQIREQKWYRVSIVSLLTSRRSEIFDICLRTKDTRASCRRRTGKVGPRAENFGDLKTPDHKVLTDRCESRYNHRYAVVVQGLATQWIQSYPCKTKCYQETHKKIMKFREPTRKPKVSYTDNSLEFGKAFEELTWNHCTSTPHRSETNGIAERAVRRIKEGTSAVLLQSNLDGKWWADSMECHCNLRNIQDLLSDGKTPYERRFGIPFNHPVIPFGAMVEYHLISAKDLSRLHQFGPKVILVADIEELKQMDASEIYAKRLNAKEVLTPMSGEKFIFPIADGTVKLSGGDQDLRTSTFIWDRPDRGEEQGIFEENQTELLQPYFKTHRCMMVKLDMISGPFQAILFTVITWKRESNCTCREQNHSQFH